MCYRNIRGQGISQCDLYDVIYEINPDNEVRGMYAIDASGCDSRVYFDSLFEAEVQAQYLRDSARFEGRRNGVEAADDCDPDLETPANAYHL